MEIFYSKPKTTIPEAKVFQDTYPSVNKIMTCIKVFNVKFSYLLQFIEAYVLGRMTTSTIIHEISCATLQRCNITDIIIGMLDYCTAPGRIGQKWQQDSCNGDRPQD